MDPNTNQLMHELLSATMEKLHHTDYEDDDSGDDEHHESRSDLLTAKATAMCVLFLASTLCGCLPFLLNRWFKWTQDNATIRSALIVKCLLYFGGGVLLCTTFMHLVPEVSENIENLQDCNLLPRLFFHLPHLLMCCGFFAMYLVEEVIHTYLHKYRKNADAAQTAFERGRSIRNSSLVRKHRSVSVSAADNIIVSNNNGLSKQDLIGHHDMDSDKCVKKLKEASIDSREAKIDLHRHDNHHHQNHHHHDHIHIPMSEDMIVSSLRGLLVVLALSLHELFEGLAVGLESQSGRVWYMFGAVSAHKLVLAFCVGVELIVTRTKLWLAIMYVITFAIVSPIGIGIGMYISSTEDILASAIPSAILQGLAAGTLLYVVFFEILSKQRSGMFAYVAFIIGFCVMFGLQFATSNGHDHGHSHGLCGHGHSHGQRIHPGHEHESEHMFMATSNDEKLKLIKEATEELAHALSEQIK